MAVAEEILNQPEGNRFINFTGSNTFVPEQNFLRMTLTRNKVGARWLKIALNDFGTYDLTFSKCRISINAEWLKLGIEVFDETAIVVKEVNGIYKDQLKETFKEITGLYTHF